MSDQPYTVNVLLKHPHAVVSRVHLAPGHETPKHAHAHDYLVHPRAATTLVKTTYRGDDVIKTETVEHTPDAPYVVGKSEDGTSFTIKNTGSAAMMCEKVLMPPKT